MIFLYLCGHCVDVTCFSCYIIHIVSSGIKYPSYFSIFFPPHGFPRLLQAYRCWCSPSAPRPEWSPHRPWATTAILPNCLGIQKIRFQNAFHLVGKSTHTHQQQVSTMLTMKRILKMHYWILSVCMMSLLCMGFAAKLREESYKYCSPSEIWLLNLISMIYSKTASTVQLLPLLAG